MEKIQIKDGFVLIDNVKAEFPCLIKKNRRYKKYGLAIEIGANDASKLHSHMRSVYNDYLDKHPNCVALPFAEFSVDLGNGDMKFNLQNREKPALQNTDGTPFEGELRTGSIVRLVAQCVGYVNTRCGVSLRLIGVEVVEAVSNADIARQLFGHPAANDAEDSVEEWDEADSW